MADSSIMGQCSAMRWSSDGAYSSPTLCVLKIIVLKHKIKILIEASWEIGIFLGNRTIVPEASLVVLVIIMNNPPGKRDLKEREGKLKGLDPVPFPMESLLPLTALKDEGLVLLTV